MEGSPMTPLEPWIAEKIGITEEKEKFAKEEIADYQLKRLNETVKRVRQCSPFYRRHLASCGAEPLTCLEDIAKYPLTSAEDIRQYAARFVCVSQSHINRVVTLKTSGTTGNPKRLFFTRFDQELTIDFFRCGMSTFTATNDTVMILLPGERPDSIGDLLRKAVQRIGALPIPYGFVADVSEAVSMMCQARSTCLVGAPVQILAMARYWGQWGQSRWQPQKVLLSTDYVPVVIARELQRIWNCEVYSHYGMTEMGLGGGIECRAHSGYHLREADLYFEIIDPVLLHPVPDGEYGEVVFTTLTRQGMPLIRYRTGDISRFIPGPCPCGSRLRRLEQIRTRKDGMICLGTSQKITMADLDEVVFALPEVIDFTVRVFYEARVVLKVDVMIMPNIFWFDEYTVLQVLRKLPAIHSAEEKGELSLNVAIHKHGVLISGKRTIGIVHAEKESRSHELE